MDKHSFSRTLSVLSSESLVSLISCSSCGCPLSGEVRCGIEISSKKNEKVDQKIRINGHLDLF